MPRLGFGAFLAPHHPIGEHPMLQFRRDLDLVECLGELGYDEFWCGESTSREFVASNREYFKRARDAVMAKITENPAAAALTVTRSPLLAATSSHAPDPNQDADGLAPR